MARTIYVEPVNALPSSIKYYYGHDSLDSDYGVGPPKIPHLNNAGYRPPQVMVIPENYGLNGPIDTRSNETIVNGGHPPFITEGPDVALGPVNSPTYNSATPQGLFHLKVDNAQQLARWQVNLPASNAYVPSPIPVSYESSGAATLYSGK